MEQGPDPIDEPVRSVRQSEHFVDPLTGAFHERVLFEASLPSYDALNSSDATRFASRYGALSSQEALTTLNDLLQLNRAAHDSVTPISAGRTEHLRRSDQALHDHTRLEEALAHHIAAAPRLFLPTIENRLRSDRDLSHVDIVLLLHALADASQINAGIVAWSALTLSRWTERAATQKTGVDDLSSLVDIPGALVPIFSIEPELSLPVLPDLIGAFRAFQRYEIHWHEIADTLCSIALKYPDITVGHLQTGLQSRIESIRSGCANTLSSLGTRGSSALTTLLPLLHDPSREVRDEAIQAVGNFRHLAAAAGEKLLRMYRSGTELKDSLLSALAKIGTPCDEIATLMEEKWELVKLDVASNCEGEIDDRVALGRIDSLEVRDTPDPESFVSAAAAFTPYHARGLAIFTEAFDSPDEFLRHLALSFLSEIPLFEIASSFFERVYREQPESVDEILFAVVRHGDRGEELLARWRAQSVATSADDSERELHQSIVDSIDGVIARKDEPYWRARRW